jgi:hypothetical protein
MRSGIWLRCCIGLIAVGGFESRVVMASEGVPCMFEEGRVQFSDGGCGGAGDALDVELIDSCDSGSESARCLGGMVCDVGGCRDCRRDYECDAGHCAVGRCVAAPPSSVVAHGSVHPTTSGCAGCIVATEVNVGIAEAAMLGIAILWAVRRRRSVSGM